LGKAAYLFNGAGEQTLLKRVTPTTEQREFLQTQWNALADHLKKALYDDYGYSKPMNTLRTPASTLWTALFVLTAKFMRFVEFLLPLKTSITL